MVVTTKKLIDQGVYTCSVRTSRKHIIQKHDHTAICINECNDVDVLLLEQHPEIIPGIPKFRQTKWLLNPVPVGRGLFWFMYYTMPHYLHKAKCLNLINLGLSKGQARIR